ncbi:cation transporter dimerization domain-containing protein [Geodermatophilus sp. SYSU D01062]
MHPAGSSVLRSRTGSPAEDHAGGDGHRLHAEADLDIDGRLSVTDVHRLAHDAEHRLVHDLPELRAAAIHTCPSLPEHTPSPTAA